MVDTGAAVSLFDAELAAGLGLLRRTKPEYTLDVVGIGGSVRRIPCWQIEICVLPEDLQLETPLVVGLVPGLEQPVGNLLGRDFLESVHFGLSHAERIPYLDSLGRLLR